MLSSGSQRRDRGWGMQYFAPLRRLIFSPISRTCSGLVQRHAASRETMNPAPPVTTPTSTASSSSSAACLAVHRGDLCSYVAGLGVPKRMVEELTQDTLMTAVRRFDQFRGESSLKTWLHGIALRLVLNWRRRRGNHEVCDPMESEVESFGRPWGHAVQTTALDAYLSKELCLQVDAVLGTEPEPARRLWRMVVLEDTAVASASVQLAMNHSQATAALAKTNRRLRSALHARQLVRTPK